MSVHTNNLSVKFLIRLIFLIVIISNHPVDTHAQSSDESWSTPVNLSKSGSTRDPHLIIDSNGIFHAIWIDDIDGYIYTQSINGEQWSIPIPLSLPFLVDDSSPLLLSDQNGYIHAFWKDVDNKLFYSLVLGSEFGNPLSWQGAVNLAESALDIDVAIDEEGNLHLSYVRPISSEEFPAGIYYRKSMDGGQSWSNAVTIYESKYFRSLTQSDAHVQISSTMVGSDNNIYITWDNRPINRIFLAKSFDTGDSWENPTPIEEPSASNITTTPFNIVVQPDNNNLLVIWQTGQPGSLTCSQFFKWSTNRGDTWSDRQSMFDEIIGCATNNIFMKTSDGLIYLWTSIQNQIYLHAWDGSEWSDPQNQTDLDNFINPETMNLVTFRCRQTELSMDNRIFVLGCDASGGNDIWIMNRTLGDISAWYPPPSAWSQPEIIAATGVDILSPVAISDNNNRLHIFWSQPDDAQFPEIGTSINYLHFDGQRWSLPITIFSTQQGKADQISVTTDDTDRIHVVWSGDTEGKIIYTWANATRSASRSEWARPVSLPSQQQLNSSPSIYIDHQGMMFVIYAQPINEDRGIYLVRSDDSGASWSDPLLVFDAVNEGWDKVDQPKITRSVSGHLHVLFKRLPLQETRKLESLYYSQSKDDGLTWSEPELVTEGFIPYSQIYSAGGNSIHRVWQEILDFGDLVQHDYSADDGISWQRSSTISNLGDETSQITTVLAPSNQFFLLQLVETAISDNTIREFEWTDGDWTQGNSLKLKFQNKDDVRAPDLLSSITPAGKIYGIISQKELIPNTGTSNNILWLTDHQIQTRIEIGITEQPEVTTTIQQTQTPSIATPTILPAATATQTPTVDLNTQVPNNGPAGLLNIPWIGVIFGGVLVFVILIVVLVFSRKSLA